MYITSRFLQLPIFETVQMRNSGFDTRHSSASYGILRQQYSVPSDLEHSVFPFAEAIPDFDVTSDDPEEKVQRDTITGFCSMLKALRTVLLQDMSILFDVPFYRRMLQGNALMCSETFQRPDFMGFSEDIRSKAWDSDFLPLVELTPKHHILSLVRCCPPVLETMDQPKTLEAPAPEPTAAFPVIEKVSPSADRPDDFMAMAIGDLSHLPIEIFNSPTCSSNESEFLSMDMLEIHSISSSSIISFDAEAQQRVSSAVRIAEEHADGFVATKKRRISVQCPNGIDSSNSDITAFADGPTVPDILNNTVSSVSGCGAVTARRVSLTGGQYIQPNCQHTLLDIVYDAGAEKENSIGAVNGCGGIVADSCIPEDVWYKCGFVGEESELFSTKHVDPAQTQRDTTQGSGDKEREEFINDIWNADELEEDECAGDITAVASNRIENIGIGGGPHSSFNDSMHSTQLARLSDETSDHGITFLEYMDRVATKNHTEKQEKNMAAVQEDLSSIRLLMTELVSSQRDLKVLVARSSSELASDAVTQINSLHGKLEKLSTGIEGIQGMFEAIRGSK
ncbi:hypothetical protein LPJ81_005816 [Coemansia sp. IMI 209127]|nr:hypothetical protein LPJ81_005816 [Coemansia sp. IMI 209127]